MHNGRVIGRHPRRPHLVVVLSALLIAFGSYALGNDLAAPAPAATVRHQSGLTKAHGFDICQSTTPTVLNDWWQSTLYYYVGTYIGGVTGVEECATPNREWFAKVHIVRHEPGVREIGWDFLPIFDGSQAPCTSNVHHFSESAGKAQEEGEIEADRAVAAVENRGFLSPGTIIYLDVESYEYTNATCNNAANAFVNGWVKNLHEGYGVSAGVYSSVAGADWKGFAALANPPNDVWLAEYGTGESVFAVETSHVPASDWPERRFHQYTGGEAETHEGHELLIDHDCASGIVAGWEEGDSLACYAK